MGELENERIRKLENEMEATRNALEERINFAKGASRTGSVSYTGREKISKLENEKIRKCGGLRSSKDNGEERKRVERNFDEKRLLGGWG
ncbi:hypothetical protein OL230_04370 [Capnocytophaga ochracea]|uniref:hypothetical protein n=1 Tax=Capnocytophaga ochracea TaxID=1018 RepID=UPI002232B2CA|nr:hypothetical protein [Capnocytophaga ochracea]UZD39404.1 hypothetical protein OL230_04370 [Capnocytophaga ochracea]